MDARTLLANPYIIQLEGFISEQNANIIVVQSSGLLLFFG